MQVVPKVNVERFNEIVEMLESFCSENLNSNYLALTKEICFEICEIEKTNINKGKASSWACGIVHALGLKNGLFSGKETPSLKAGELYKAFEVSSSTGLSKSKEVRNLINIENEKWNIKNIKNNNENLTKAKEEVAATFLEESYEKIERVVDEELLKANKIAHEAWKQKNYNQKVKLAKEALEISKDCSEAYIILSYDNKLNSLKQKEFALEAVEAAKRVIGEENVENYIGKFLEDDVAKGYYSSKYRLGNLLWSLGEKKDAIKEYLDLIKLCPRDRFLVRATLASWLISEKMTKELEDLLEQYKNDNLTALKFTKALYLFSIGNIEEAERALKISNVLNKYVLDYIIRQRRIPKELPEVKKIGTEEDAIHYMKNGELAWKSVDGAINWAKEFKKNQPF
ncbi:hypothetical protein JCM1393_26100 [Clostridium carnis]